MKFVTNVSVSVEKQSDSILFSAYFSSQKRKTQDKALEAVGNDLKMIKDNMATMLKNVNHKKQLKNAKFDPVSMRPHYSITEEGTKSLLKMSKTTNRAIDGYFATSSIRLKWHKDDHEEYAKFVEFIIDHASTIDYYNFDFVMSDEQKKEIDIKLRKALNEEALALASQFYDMNNISDWKIDTIKYRIANHNNIGGFYQSANNKYAAPQMNSFDDNRISEMLNFDPEYAPYDVYKDEAEYSFVSKEG